AQLGRRQLLVVHHHGAEDGVRAWSWRHLRDLPRRHDAKLGDDDARARALPWYAVKLELVVRAINHAEALVHISQANARPLHAPGVRRQDPDAVVDDVDDGVVALAQAAD